MRIAEIDIHTYRSLYAVHLEPGSFSVLAGPNNAGKSNIADAIDFISEVHSLGLNIAVQRKGGYENIAHRRIRRSKQPISISVTGILSDAEIDQRRPQVGHRTSRTPRYRVTHTFAVRSTSQTVETGFHVESEAIRVSREDQPQLELPHLTGNLSADLVFGVVRHRDEIRVDPAPISEARPDPASLQYPFNDPAFLDFLRQRADAGDLLLSTLTFNPIVAAFSRAIQKIKVYQLSPVESRRSGVPSSTADLDRHGANLPTKISNMKRSDPKAWEKVLSATRTIIPTLSDVAVAFTHDRRLTLEFQEEGVGRPWTTEEVSDGTIQSLALLVALNDRESPFLVIEEPENSLHPWILRVFVDLCRQQRDKQVMITTHSPALLSYTRPQDVSVVWREGGRTQIAPLPELDSNAISSWDAASSSVFDLLDSGLISQSVPPSD